MRRLEDFVPADHPLRPIRAMFNKRWSGCTACLPASTRPTSRAGHPSIAPEKLPRANLLQILFSVRSERQFMEQAQYNLLYRWFIGPAMDDSVLEPAVFTENHERLIAYDAIIELFNHIVNTFDCEGWLSGEHFSVDGTLIQAWASRRSSVRKDSTGDEERDDDKRVQPTSKARPAATIPTSPDPTPMHGCTTRKDC